MGDCVLHYGSGVHCINYAKMAEREREGNWREEEGVGEREC